MRILVLAVLLLVVTGARAEPPTPDDIRNAVQAGVDDALSLYRERGRERDAFPVVQRWIQTCTAWAGGGPAFLGLVEKYGTKLDLVRAIEDTAAWLASTIRMLITILALGNVSRKSVKRMKSFLMTRSDPPTIVLAMPV